MTVGCGRALGRLNAHGPGALQLRPFTAFAKGIAQWHTELLTYFDEHTTTGYAKGVINMVEVIKRPPTDYPPSLASAKRIVIACGRTGQHGATARSTGTSFQPTYVVQYSAGDDTVGGGIDCAVGADLPITGTAHSQA